MKIAVCGKGGVGKSTVSVLLAEEFAKEGKKVLVVDTDESNYGLHKELGLELPRDFMEFFGGKGDVAQNFSPMDPSLLTQFTQKFFNGTWGMEDVPEGYYSEKRNIRLMANGKIHKAGEGCACTMNAVLREFLANLTLKDDEICLMDMDAGIEHFGRGVDDGADVVLMVVDPSFESARLSQKIQELCEGINKPLYYILNKVTEANRSIMHRQIADETKIILEVSEADELAMAGLLGQELAGMIEQIAGLDQVYDRIKVG